MEKKILLAILTAFLLINISYVSATLNDGLIVYYPMDEDSGIAIDSVAGNNAVNNTDLYYVTGKVGNAVNLTGSNYLEIDHNIQLTNSASWSFWINPRQVGGKTIISKRQTNDNWQMYLDGFGEFEAFFWHPTLTSVKSNEQFPANVWSFGVATWDGSVVRLYIDGINVKNESLTGTLNNDNVNTRIGEDWYGGYYDGLVDELGIWNRSLTDEEVTQLYNGGLGLAYSEFEPVPIAVASIDVNLVNPEDLTNTTNVNVTFNATIIPSNLTLSNATLYLWLTNGDEYLSDFTTLSGNETTQVIFTETLDINEYLYNVYACGENVENASDIQCAFAPSNYTLIISQTPPVEETITEESNLIQGTGVLYTTMKSSGAGLGKFMQYITQSLPLLLIGIMIVGVVFIIGMAVASIFKQSLGGR